MSLGLLFFLGSIGLLIAGYAFYGLLISKILGIDPARLTPAHTSADGVDYVPMSPIRLFFIQLLNIAGLGPVAGPILGALYGPVALLWVVFGCIFAGAVHDFCAGFMSMRQNGASYPELVAGQLGERVRHVTELFSIVFMVLVGTVFVTGPAALLASMTPFSLLFWVVVVFIYYFLATILPINTLIGRLYPFFAFILLLTAFWLMGAMLLNDRPILPNLDFFTNTHPAELPVWPLIFITIACGAISGFHATQSPMVARCITNERYARPLFYGGMIAEGMIALIWVTLGLSFYESPEMLQAVIKEGSPTLVVKEIAVCLLGSSGSILAILGVVMLPITSGDTAFRSARLMLSDAFKLSQHSIKNRMLMAAPLFAVGIWLSFTDFDIIWRYFGWMNQTLASLTLWCIALFLMRSKRFHWVATLPALLMTSASVCYLFYAPIGFNLPLNIATGLALTFTAGCFALFLYTVARFKKQAQVLD